MVDYYGAETPLNQLASISVSSGTQLVVSPFDKSGVKDIETALIDANLGMTRVPPARFLLFSSLPFSLSPMAHSRRMSSRPNSDGELIRLNIPALTEDRRKEILKQAKAVGEEAKVSIRNIRKKSNDAVKKQGKELGEDIAKDANDQIQKLTDKLIKNIDAVVADKEKDIMTV